MCGILWRVITWLPTVLSFRMKYYQNKTVFIWSSLSHAIISKVLIMKSAKRGVANLPWTLGIHLWQGILSLLSFSFPDMWKVQGRVWMSQRSLLWSPGTLLPSSLGPCASSVLLPLTRHLLSFLLSGASLSHLANCPPLQLRNARCQGSGHLDINRNGLCNF